MKKTLAVVLVLIMSLSLLAGCAAPTNTNNDNVSTQAQNEGSGQVIQEGSAPVAAIESDSDTQATATTEQVDFISYGLDFSSADWSPFGPSGSRDQYIAMFYPKLVHLPYFGCPIEDAEMWLAKSVTKVDDLTYKVEIYDYIKTNQGHSITSEDVKWSYEKCMTEGARVEVTAVLDNIEIVDDYNMIFHLKDAAPNCASIALGFSGLSIVSKEWYESCTSEQLTTNAASAAAYYIKECVPGSYILLEANDNYWKTDDSLKCGAEMQNVKTIYLPVYAEPAVRAAAIESGEIDGASIAGSSNSLFVTDGKVRDGFRATAVGGYSVVELFFNMDTNVKYSYFCDNLKARQAVMYAIDREAMALADGLDANTLFLNFDTASCNMRGYNKDWANTYPSYNPEKAKQLLEESGCMGKTIKLVYSTRRSATMLAVVKENLEAIGFKVDLVGYESALFQTYRFDPNEWDILMDLKSGSSYMDLQSILLNTESYDNCTVNFVRDDKLNELFRKAYYSADQEDINALHDYVTENAYMFGTYSYALYTILQDGILEGVWAGTGYPMINQWTFSEDYESNAIRPAGY